MRRYLSGYSVFRRLAEQQGECLNYFGNPTKNDDSSMSVNDESTEARVKMFEIRRFVTSLPPGDEKVLLFFHYIHGDSVEKCAERMEIAARSAYRLQKRALLMAYRRYARLKKNADRVKCIE